MGSNSLGMDSEGFRLASKTFKNSHLDLVLTSLDLFSYDYQDVKIQEDLGVYSLVRSLSVGGVLSLKVITYDKAIGIVYGLTASSTTDSHGYSCSFSFSIPKDCSLGDSGYGEGSMVDYLISVIRDIGGY